MSLYWLAGTSDFLMKWMVCVSFTHPPMPRANRPNSLAADMLQASLWTWDDSTICYTHAIHLFPCWLPFELSCNAMLWCVWQCLTLPLESMWLDLAHSTVNSDKNSGVMQWFCDRWGFNTQPIGHSCLGWYWFGCLFLHPWTDHWHHWFGRHG